MRPLKQMPENPGTEEVTGSKPETPENETEDFYHFIERTKLHNRILKKISEDLKNPSNPLNKK